MAFGDGFAMEKYIMLDIISTPIRVSMFPQHTVRVEIPLSVPVPQKYCFYIIM